MKKTIVVIIGLLIASIGYTQSLPNSDFEIWEDLISEPESWNTPNPITGLVLVKTVTKSEDAYSGLYAARLETKEINFIGNIFQVPGMLTLGEFELNLADTSYGFSGGLFLQENVSQLSGMYKYSGVDGDSAFVFIYNYKRNGEVMDTIGYGYKHLHDAADWTPFTVDMQLLSNQLPDTFNVVLISSGSQSPKVGSVLLLDSLDIHINTGFNDSPRALRGLKFFPNPATDELHFELAERGLNRVLYIYNTKGQMLLETPFNELDIRLSIDHLSAGVYSFRITDQNRLPGSGTFIKY